jgi:lysophospholipase L1-like esterase
MRGSTSQHRWAWRRLGALVVVVATLGSWSGTASAQAPTTYVALGDSFVAGPLIPNQLADPLGCLRSDHDYPHVLAPATGHVLRDASCSGAETDDMFAAQNVTPGPNPPQLDALSADTRLVTISIGGNDIGFSDIIQSCVTLLPWQTPCRDTYLAGGQDEISRRIAETAPKVGAVLDAVHARAPNARVLVVAYPAIVPDSGSGCWPQMPIGWNDVSYLRAKHRELNAMLASQAAAHGDTYVDAYTPSIGHDACRSALVRWVEPIIPTNPAAPVHPNARGMAGVAAAAQAAL